MSKAFSGIYAVAPSTARPLLLGGRGDAPPEIDPPGEAPCPLMLVRGDVARRKGVDVVRATWLPATPADLMEYRVVGATGTARSLVDAACAFHSPTTPAEFRAASRALGVDPKTVKNRITRLCENSAS